ncbi:cytochrome P450 [Lentzea sp. NPDC059081]|uniref:cytochrome P450 family protein n=1 Tax=Lentzea sp. NPDC059081 TaxID=3346719 RepID=UPI003692B632
MADPYPILRKIQDEHAAFPVENGGFRMWVVTRYDDARAILGDPSMQRDLVKHRYELMERTLLDIERRPKLPRELQRSMLDQDGDDHRRLRSVISKFFVPSRIDRLRSRVEEVADELLDRLPVGEPVDLVARYARGLVATGISELLGVPEGMRGGFPVWETDVLTAPTKAGVEEAARLLTRFARELVALKRAQPAADVLTELVQAADRGAMDEVELMSMITLLLVAGMEPASAISSGILALLTHPEELRAVLDDPALMPDCVEEVIRFETPFRMLAPRYLDHPMELDGVTIPAGELILISTGGANRDPRQFADPDTFQAARCPRGHLGFSHGIHRCLGAELGRLQTAVGLQRLFTRFPDSRLVHAAEDAKWRPGMVVRRLAEIPVVLA